MKLRYFTTLLIISLVSAIGAQAADNPEDLIKTVGSATNLKPEKGQAPEARWQRFLQRKGWDSGLSDGGVVFIPERELIISSAAMFTKVQPGQPGWIESRVAAFEKAEMEAKTKIIRYLTETVSTKRSLSMLERAVWRDGEMNNVRKLGEVAKTLERIGKKSLALAERKIDSALQKLDPDYDPSNYEGKSREELEIIAEDLFNRQVKAVALGTLIGVTALYSTEALVANNEYKVLVGVIWSPKLNRLAMRLFNDEYRIPPVSPGKKLAKQIPTDQLTLLGTTGTRIVIDENGQYAVIAYGQAQPRKTGPGRQQTALHNAKQIAANRARGQIVNFIREGITLRDAELSQELSREFSDLSFGTETVRDYQKKIIGKNVKVKISGLRVLKEWSFDHPATGQRVAGAVVAWSPAAAKISKQAGHLMRAQSQKGSQKKRAAKTSDKANPISGTPKIESMKVDTSAY